MKKTDYPALYQAADDATASAQRTFLNIVRFEYCLLVVAAVLALNFGNNAVYNVTAAVVFFALIGLLLFRSLSGPDRVWYNGRAISESIKTLTWRYMMRAAPFSGNATDETSLSEFLELLKGILKSNQELGKLIAKHAKDGDEVTAYMKATRSTGMSERRKFYDDFRIADQKAWYASKARWNSRRFVLFVVILIAIYTAAAISVLLKIKFQEFTYYPTEPLIALAGAMLGWVQIKKYNELSAAYSLTSHEIGLIKANGANIRSEEQFSEYVNDAELAFSREHTQWIARQAG